MFDLENDDWGSIAELQLQGLRKDLKSFSESGDLPSTPVMPVEKSIKVIAETDERKKNEEENSLTAENFLTRKIAHSLLVKKNAYMEHKKNINSPLYSVKSFEQLKIPKSLLRGVYSMGFNFPSKIQEISLPALLAYPPVNMIAQAQTGTGKTAAFLLASLSRVNPEAEYPQVLILCPTYELALQTGQVAKRMATYYTGITFQYAVTGTRLQNGEAVKEHVIIGTPGKTFDWIKGYQHFDIKKIRVFVLDEADHMLSIRGHQDKCIRVNTMLSSDCQMLLFSATYPKEVMEFAEQIINDPIVIRLRREEETLDNIQQYYIPCPSSEDKYKALKNIYGAISIGQTIIFCRRKATASYLGNELAKDGHSVCYLSSDLSVDERNAVFCSFREGKVKVMITTDICARGIDVPRVTLVINFDMPVINGHADYETYLYRIGRTGRFGKFGIAVNFISAGKDEEVLKDIQEHFKKPIFRIDSNTIGDLEKLD